MLFNFLLTLLEVDDLAHDLLYDSIESEMSLTGPVVDASLLLCGPMHALVPREPLAPRPAGNTHDVRPSLESTGLLDITVISCLRPA